MSFTKTAVSAAISGSLAIVFLVGALISSTGLSVSNPDTKMSSPKPSSTASATPNPKECAASWKMETSTYANNRWFSDGITEIKTAKTPEDAAKAAKVWTAGVRKDASLLAGAAKYFLKQDVDKATLTDSKGCASDKAVDLAIALDLKLANAQSIVPDQAPSNGYNSGVNGGNVIGDTTPGVGGNRTAIKIILEDGSTIWIMARCGNVVTNGPPPVPPGTTDNPPPPPKPVCIYNPALSPDSPYCHQSKDPKADVVAPQGTTPLGHDPVQTTAPAPKPAPLQPTTPVVTNPGTPAPGASPAPVTPTPAPSIPPSQAPAPTDPGTPIGVPAD